MSELNDLQLLQTEQLESVFISPIEGLLKVLETLKERSKNVQRLCHSYDSASDRYAVQLQGKKKQRAKAMQSFEETKSAFRTASFDYTIWLRAVQGTLRSRLLKQTAMLWFGMRTFHNSSDRMLRALEPFAQEVSQAVFEQENIDKTSTLELEQQKHALLQKRTTTSSSTSGRVAEGYLFLKKSGNKWVRRYYSIGDGQLSSQSGKKVNLVCATVKQAPDGPLCFQLIFPPDKELVFQASNVEEKEFWVSALQIEIERLLNANTPTEKRGREADNDGGNINLKLLAETDAGNSFCVDCSSPNPSWGSLNLGILFCINCSGAHRSLGVHVSKVRSFRLDAWSDEDLDLMKRLGNTRVNRILEESTGNADDPPRPTSDSTIDERKAFVFAKYAKRQFLMGAQDRDPATTVEMLDRDLFEAVKNLLPLPQVLLHLLHGADPNYHCAEEANTTPLLWACQHQDVALAQLLIYHGAKVNEPDSTNWTPLHTAANKGDLQLISILLAKGAKLSAKNANDGTPEEVATEAEHGDAATYLRLAALAMDDTSGEYEASLTDLLQKYRSGKKSKK